MLNAGCIFPCFGGILSARGRAALARFALLTKVRKSAGHQLVSPVDLPTKYSYLAKGTDRLANSHKILATHGLASIVTCTD